MSYNINFFIKIWNSRRQALGPNTLEKLENGNSREWGRAGGFWRKNAQSVSRSGEVEERLYYNYSLMLDKNKNYIWESEKISN